MRTLALSIAFAATLFAATSRELNDSGIVDLSAGKLPAAEQKLTEAISLSSGDDLIEYQTNLALAFILDQQFARAEALLRRARFLAESQSAVHPQLGAIFGELSKASAAQAKWSLAEEYARLSIAALEKQPRGNPLGLVYARMNLAGVFIDSGNAAEGERLLLPVIEEERRLVPRSRPLAYAVRRLAEIRVLQNNFTAAQILYRGAIGLYESALGPTHPELGPVLRAYSDTLRRTHGSKAEVRAIEARAKAIETASAAS